MIARAESESQRAYDERVLRSEGRIATYDVLYGLAYETGMKCSITRLAAIVCDLRNDGWDIATEADSGTTAVYRAALIPRSTTAVAVAPPRTSTTPAFGDYAAIRQYVRPRPHR